METDKSQIWTLEGIFKNISDTKSREIDDDENRQVSFSHPNLIIFYTGAGSAQHASIV